MRRYGKGCSSCTIRKHKILASHANILTPPTVSCNVDLNPFIFHRISDSHPAATPNASSRTRSTPGVSRSLLKFTPYIFPGLFRCFQLTLKLGVLHRTQNAAENGSRPIAHLLQVLPGHQPRRPDLFRRRFLQELRHKSIRLQPPVAGKAVEPVQFQMLLKARQPDEALERRG